ncbi:hypothetical protein ACSQ67_023728 [Phaseolus vulgaris]
MSELDAQIPTAFDPFAEANADDSGAGSKEYVHIRVQQRNGRKSLTTVQGLKKEFSYNKILKDVKKEFCCNGTVVQDPELGQVIQLQGDQRKNVSTFLVQMSFEKVDDSWFLKDGDHNENHGVQSVDQEGVDVPNVCFSFNPAFKFSITVGSISVIPNVLTPCPSLHRRQPLGMRNVLGAPTTALSGLEGSVWDLNVEGSDEAFQLLRGRRGFSRHESLREEGHCLVRSPSERDDGRGGTGWVKV